jgi:hypothetical protein
MYALDGSLATITEILSRACPMMQDVHVQEGNLEQGNRTTMRTSLPTGTWVGYNEGWSTGKGTVSTFTDEAKMCKLRSVLDVELANYGGNAAANRAAVDLPAVGGLAQQMETAVLYSNAATAPKEPLGLTPRYNSLSGATARNIVNAGGSGSYLSSIWFCTWGPQTGFLFYPRGSSLGLKQEDKGQILVTDSGGTNQYWAYVTEFTWKLGLAIADWRYFARVCNIAEDALVADAASGVDLYDKMITAWYKRPAEALGDFARTYIYCTPTVAEYLHKQALSRAFGGLTPDTVAGAPVTRFMGVPIRISDKLKPTVDATTTGETVVS